jgi:hypothetical protein
MRHHREAVTASTVAGFGPGVDFHFAFGAIAATALRETWS